MGLVEKALTEPPTASLLKIKMNSNENQIQVEVVQPEINSQIHRTTLEELREWIRDGKLQPNHQVRIKNLSWVEAQKIPAFKALFEAKRNDQTGQLNHSYNQTLTVAPEPDKPPAVEEKPLPKSKFFSLKKEADSSDKEKSISEKSAENENKPAEPSVIFQAFEKKFLARVKPTKTKTKSSDKFSELQKKSPFKKKNVAAGKNKKSFLQNKNLILKRAFILIAGCLLAGLLSYGGSYLWIYQLKTAAQIDEKSLPEIASLQDKLTSDKLGLRLKEEARNRELKESGNQENPAGHQDIAQQIAQLEKQVETKRKAVVEKHKIRVQETDFNMTFSFSFVVLLVGFVLVRVFYDKNSQTTEPAKSAKSTDESEIESDDLQADKEVKADEETLQNGNAEQESNTENSAPENETIGESSSTDIQDKPENFPKIIYVSESVSENKTSAKTNNVQLPPSIKCLEHPDAMPKFYCDVCENYFCNDCAKSFSESGNYCPFCRMTCKPIEIRIDSEGSPKNAPEQKKKPNLLELGKDSVFVVYDFPDERNYKLGVIPAFVIALLFSTSISIFWVYKISPYLESRNQEVAQNASPNALSNPETPNNKPTETLSQTAPKNGEPAANEPCVNPTTKETFECDDATRQALYEQNRKTKAVEDAQKKVAEKSGVIGASENSSTENADQTAKQPSAEELAKKESEKQQLIKTFGISFVIIFGLLLSTRLFHKEKNLQPE